MNPVTPSRNPLSPPPAITLSLELWRLRAAHARLARGHAANDSHTHAMLILLPLSLCSVRSTGLPVPQRCARDQIVGESLRGFTGALMRDAAFVLIEAFIKKLGGSASRPACCRVKVVCVLRIQSQRSLCLVSVKSGIFEGLVQQVQLKIRRESL